MQFEPSFDDGQFKDLTKGSESEEYDDEEEQEYDAINDETFGGTINEINENDLEAFANRTADLILDDPSCSINAPDPSQIPLPQVNSVFRKGNYERSYDKIWDTTVFDGIHSMVSDLSNDINKSSASPSNTSRKPKVSPQLDLSGAKTLEEIERDALLTSSSSNSAMPSLRGLVSGPASSSVPQITAIPLAKPVEPLSVEELEKRMLFEAALASSVSASGAAPNAIAQAISHLRSHPPPAPNMPWQCNPSPMGRFPSGMMPTFPPLPFLTQQGNTMRSSGFFPPPPFFGPDGLPRPPMYSFQGPPPHISNAYSGSNACQPVKNFTDSNNHQQQHPNNSNQKNVRGVFSVPSPWVSVERHSHSNNQSPYFKPNSVAQCGYSRNTPSIQGSTTSTPNHNRQRQKGLPSGKTISDFAFDPYGGFMSKKEREWLIKIHLIQCMGGGEPMEDDFYYTMWKRRNVLVKTPEEWKVKLQPKYYNFDDTYPSASYIHPSFSGSLGRPTHCTANFPRQIIDLSVDNTEEDLSTTKSTQKKLKAVLMRIENASLVLLKCDELKRKLASGGLNEEEKNACKSALEEQMGLLISCTCAKDKLPTIMLIQKGRALLFQIMAGVLQQTHLFDILKVLVETMPRYAKKIPDASVTDCIKSISGLVSLLTKGQFVELANLAVLDKELINTSKLVQLVIFTFLVGLSKQEINIDVISNSSLHYWLNEEAKEYVLLKEIEKLFSTEDLILLTQWLVTQDVIKPTNCAQKMVSWLKEILLNSNKSSYSCCQ